MKKYFVLLFSVFILTLAYSNCSSQFQTVPLASGGPGLLGSTTTLPGGVTTTTIATAGTLPIIGTESNVLPLSVGCGYINQLCVSVQVCIPGTTQCETISNLLLDTGSAGLRVFSSALSSGLRAGLTQSQDGSGRPIGECISYADGTSQWGPVKIADVVLGKERASQIPIQIIDSSFGTPPNDCTNLDSAFAGYNGIIGVSLFKQDCGPGCTTISNNRIYFVCSGTTCTSSTVSLAQQVVNPVSALPVNNNGVAVQMNNVGSSGAANASGYLVLGIGTQSNNTLSGVSVFKANSYGNFQTQFNGTNLLAFIDSGSNGLFFPTVASLPACSGSFAGFYCPSSVQYFTATQISSDNLTQKSIAFSIDSASVLVGTGNKAFNNLGGQLNGDFDWGLPFFFGRTVFVGIEGKSSNLGTGPYWAY